MGIVLHLQKDEDSIELLLEFGWPNLNLKIKPIQLLPCPFIYNHIHDISTNIYSAKFLCRRWFMLTIQADPGPIVIEQPHTQYTKILTDFSVVCMSLYSSSKDLASLQIMLRQVICKCIVLLRPLLLRCITVSVTQLDGDKQVPEVTWASLYQSESSMLMDQNCLQSLYLLKLLSESISSNWCPWPLWVETRKYVRCWGDQKIHSPIGKPKDGSDIHRSSNRKWVCTMCCAGNL